MITLKTLVAAATLIGLAAAPAFAANFDLTANAGTVAFNIAPSTLQIAEGFTGDITLLIFGSTAGPVNVFSSVPALVTVTTPVTASGSGSTALTVHATGASTCSTGAVTITAVDSAGAAATSSITIVDSASNNAGCP